MFTLFVVAERSEIESMIIYVYMAMIMYFKRERENTKKTQLYGFTCAKQNIHTTRTAYAQIQ